MSSKAQTQWPRVDLSDSQALLTGALKDIARINKKAVKGIVKSTQFYKPDEKPGNLKLFSEEEFQDIISPNSNSPTSPKVFEKLDINLIRRLKPQAT